MQNVEVSRNAEESRFELRVDSEVAGVIDYVQNGEQLVLTHTGVSDDHSGQGLAATLVEEALKDVQGQGQRIVPQCSYVQGYIRKHPQWNELVA
jgi:predicted GNAT family acetyltransferase